MLVTQLLHLSLIFATVLCSESPEREVHRLVGGHLKIVNSGADDAELLEADSSGSKEKSKKSNSSNGGDEEKKTLAQQVVEGKYGLIQQELFKKPLKQPGIISYDANPEIPKDNINNLGGLSKEDIWLAENHLLVINGGTYPKYDNTHDNNDAIWPAIDNYTAPKRPVKIPSHPKVPPPFPVQLTEDGPLQILGTNSSTTLEGPPSIYALPLPEGGYVPGTGPFFPQYPDQTNPTSGGASNKNPSKTSGEGERGPPFPPYLNGSLPPSFAHLPPGAVAVLPPPSINEVDEDDPSIYYPPPYSFLYPSKENSSLVPAGPLVPGIILPPPPDFFAPLDLPTTKKTKKRPTAISKRPKIPKTTEQSPQIHPTTTPISPTSVINITLRKPIKVIPNNPTDINNELKPFIETTTAKKNRYESTTRSYSSKTRIPSRPQTKRPAVTKLKPVKSFAPHRTYYSDNSANGKPFAVYGPPESTTTPKTMISSTQVPLTHYYSTSDDINLNVVTIIPEKNTAKPAQYYYYEEEPQTKSITTTNRPNKIVQNFFNLPDHYYETPRQLSPYRNPYVYVTPKPLISVKPTYNSVQKSRNPDSFRQHLSQLKKQIQYYTSPRPSFREIQSPRPVYQYSFQAANYKAQNQFRPSQPETQSDEEGFRPMPKYSVQIQPAIEIPSSQPIARNPIYFKQTFRATTEPPYQSQSYYSTTKPNHNYQENVHKKGRTINRPQSVAQYTFQAAPVNQDYRGYYTSPGNNYYNDENNKFSTFGQRIPSRTTPTPSVRYSTRAPNVVYVTANANSARQQNPISLEHDTLVNYLNPRPNINPDAEYISVKNTPRENYPQVVKFNQRPIQQYNINQQQGNFNSRPQIVNALPINVPNEEKGSFISYSLPGDNGAHFYFLTPQLAQSRDQGAGFYYSQNDKDRIRRNSDNNKT
ncbi:hypothetical protein WA026_015624 [Henosepilachna vigintioctopunctata]|uniref:Uncharacterized protein n=1 Tax=Henosepilachna vigintioctopunctata TaxID=420089 RepID=A0AAW1V7H4_9CUCU